MLQQLRLAWARGEKDYEPSFDDSAPHGPAMRVLGLGTWELTRATSDTILHALRLGYRMIDTAVDYGSQPEIGEALAHTEIPREDVFLVAKVEEGDDAYNATLRYLEEMRQDYADLMLIHRPSTPRNRPRALGRSGPSPRVRLHQGDRVSNYSTRQLEAVRMKTVQDIEPGWHHAIQARRPVVVDATTDPEVPPAAAAHHDRG